MFTHYLAPPMDHYLRCMLGKLSTILSHHIEIVLTSEYSHIEVNESTHGNLFFWLFHNRHLADKSRTIIWLNGGPGCSSMDGALMEVGPYRVRKEGKLEYNNGSWDEFANLLFIDQPVGTGFSYVDTNAYLTELDQMADQMVVFLEKFFALFPEYGHDDVSLSAHSTPALLHHVF